MIQKLRTLNQQSIEKYIKSENGKAIIKHRIIEQILLDDECFEKMTIENAADILKTLGIKDWKAVYVELLKK